MTSDDQAASKDPSAELRRTQSEVSLCYRELGRGPTVVMLHGTTATLGIWDPIATRTSRSARVIAVDQRGHGRSDKPATGYTVTEFCDDLHAVIAELGCAPAVIVGHSLGARNAVVLAATHPGLVAGVVALDYTPYIEPEVLDELEQRVRAGDRTFGSSSEIADYLRARYPLMPPDAVQRRVEYGYYLSRDGYRPYADPSAMVQTVDGLRRDFVDELRAVECPVTLLRGAQSRLVSPTAFERTRADRPDLRAETVPDADHYLPEVAPGAVCTAIERMLADVT